MAEYFPPEQILPFFNPNVFKKQSEALTIAEADARYLRYPTAQGLENFTDINVFGDASFNQNVSILGNVDISGSIIMNNLDVSDNLIVGNTTLSQPSLNFTVENGTNNGRIDIKVRDGSGTVRTIQIDQFTNLSGINDLNCNRITTSGNATINGTLNVTNTTTLSNPLIMGNLINQANRAISSSFYNFYDTLSPTSLVQNGSIYNAGGAMYILNSTNNGSINLITRDAGGNQIFSQQIFSNQSLFNKQITMASNNNIVFSAGTGTIIQTAAVISGDLSSSNAFRRSSFAITSGSASGSGTYAIEAVDNTTGRGLFILPSAAGGNLSSTVLTGDCVIATRIQNGGSITITNWNSNFKNGLRIYTTDVDNAGLTLQCGSSTNFTEFRMDFNRTLGTYNTSLNNPLNFNPTTYGEILPSRRQIIGLGTLSFTDINGGNTGGTATSTIYSDTSTSFGGINGMFYRCGINNGAQAFSVRSSTGTERITFFTDNTNTSVSGNFIVRNPSIFSNRIDLSVSTDYNVLYRSVVATANAVSSINFNTDTADASGIRQDNPVLTLNYQKVEVKRPIEFNYLTNPSSNTQLGFLTSLNFPIVTSVSSLSSPLSIGNITLPAGSWNITASFIFEISQNDTLDIMNYGISNTSTAFTTTLPYGISIIQDDNVPMRFGYPKIKQVSMPLQITTSTTLYFLVRCTFNALYTMNFDLRVNYMRIG